MQIGDLDRRISIEESAWNDDKSQDDFGQPNNYSLGTWSSVGPATTVWAHMEWLDGSLSEESDKTTATEKVKFTIRAIGWNNANYYKVLSSSRIKWSAGGKHRYYYIDSVKWIDGRDQFIELEAEEKL
tara:strand:- start:227 stop:610 length:384 start_codon:yes stop_codon:yes gene_type:complete